jgi:hypothetical protein
MAKLHFRNVGVPPALLTLFQPLTPAIRFSATPHLSFRAKPRGAFAFPIAHDRRAA